jgi:hypothetical protein
VSLTVHEKRTGLWSFFCHQSNHHMKVVGKVGDIDNVTAQEKAKYFLHQEPVIDHTSCSCQFGYACDQEIDPHQRIVDWVDVNTVSQTNKPSI